MTENEQAIGAKRMVGHRSPRSGWALIVAVAAQAACSQGTGAGTVTTGANGSGAATSSRGASAPGAGTVSGSTGSTASSGAGSASGGAGAGDSSQGGPGAGSSSGSPAPSDDGGAGTTAGGGGSSSGSGGSVATSPEGGSGLPPEAGIGGDAGSAASGCAGKPYKLCEDFESGSAGGLPAGWTKFKGYGAGSPNDVGLSTEQAHSGRMALKSDSMTTGQTRAQKSLSAIGATASKHWGRIFYKVQSPAPKPNGGVIHITFTGLMGPAGENRVVDTVENSQGAHQWLFNIPSDGCCAGSSYNWKFDADWHCAEWYVDVGTKSFRFFSDSSEVTQLAFTGRANSNMSNYTSVIVGAEFYQTPPSPFVIWFDDLAIDDNRVGCQ